MKPTRSARSVLLLAGLLLPLSGCGKLEWKDFTSNDGKYTILMPAKVQEQNRTEQTAAGPITIHASIAEVRNGAYLASWSDLPPGAPFDFKGGVEGMRARYEGKVLEDKEVAVAGVKGRAFEMEIKKPKGYAAGRMFIVKNRLYQLVVVGSDARLASANVQKFLDSFKLQEAAK